MARPAGEARAAAPVDQAVYLGQAGRLKTHADLLADMRALAHDLRAAAATGVAVPADLADGLASVLEHAARSLDAGIGVVVDLDEV